MPVPGPLEEQPVLLTAETSLQPLNSFCVVQCWQLRVQGRDNLRFSCGSERMGILTGTCIHTGCVASAGTQGQQSGWEKNTSRLERRAFGKSRIAEGQG